MRELSVAERRYKAFLAVIADGKSVTDDPPGATVGFGAGAAD